MSNTVNEILFFSGMALNQSRNFTYMDTTARIDKEKSSGSTLLTVETYTPTSVIIPRTYHQALPRQLSTTTSLIRTPLKLAIHAWTTWKESLRNNQKNTERQSDYHSTRVQLPQKNYLPLGKQLFHS